MNLRKGFFRLTLVFSILVGMVSSFWVLEHAIESRDGIVRRSLPYFFQFRIEWESENRTMKRIINQFPPGYFRDEPSQPKTHESFGPDYVLYWWRHLALLSIPGFVTVWFIYGLTGWVIIPFIVRGFQGNSVKGGKTD
jgi:hypothetical protein